MRRTSAVAVDVVVVALGAILYAGCGAAETTTVDTESAPVPALAESAPAEPVPAEPEPIVPDEPPRAGAWEATALGSEGFESFEFEVNEERTAVVELVTAYSGIECGPVDGVRTTQACGRCMTGSTWSVDAGEFTIDPSSRDDFGFEISGVFDAAGSHAEGTWKAVWKETTCAEGTWEAQPKDMDSEV